MATASDPEVPCVATTITASSFCNSASVTLGIRLSIC
jgi:hypothetical protein